MVACARPEINDVVGERIGEGLVRVVIIMVLSRRKGVAQGAGHRSACGAGPKRAAVEANTVPVGDLVNDGRHEAAVWAGVE